jgi:thiol-disulfide isomerase/thioredoxin
MRTLLAAALLLGLAAGPAVAGDATKKLGVGDPAPALKATKWLQGQEVSKFESGKVYVVEFWATWCGPCIVVMPHVADLQAEYKDKGVTFIGFSAVDKTNTEARVAAFVKKRGAKLNYTFAFADNRTTYDAWMRAAGRGGIPCAFVVDKAGKIAYIGHPMFLDVVLPKVVAGTWKGQASVKEMAGVEKEVNDVFASLRGKDPAVSLKAITDFETKHTALANIPYFVGPKLDLLVKTGKTDEAKKFAEAVLEKATRQEDPMALGAVARALGTPDAKGNKELAALGAKAAEQAKKIQ